MTIRLDFEEIYFIFKMFKKLTHTAFNLYIALKMRYTQADVTVCCQNSVCQHFLKRQT